MIVRLLYYVAILICLMTFCQTYFSKAVTIKKLKTIVLHSLSPIHNDNTDDIFKELSNFDLLDFIDS